MGAPALKERREEGLEQVPFEVQLAGTMVSALVEQIARLPKESKDDLAQLLLLMKDCTDPDEMEENAQTMREILCPGLIGHVVEGAFGPARRSERVVKRANSIGSRIRELRQARGWTQVQLAERSDLPQSHVSRLEAGEHSPSYRTLEKLANAFEVSAGDIDPAD